MAAGRILPLILSLALCVLAMIPLHVRADNPIASERALKAAYLYHFVQFAQWPVEGSKPDYDLRICIRPEHPLVPALSALNNQNVHGQRLQLDARSQLSLDVCSVLVVSRDDRELLTQLALVRRPLLTVTDDPALPLHDVIISMRVEERRVIFSVNNTRASESGLIISSRLLRLAEIVQ